MVFHRELLGTEGRFEGTFEGVKPTQGIFGAGGDFNLTEGKNKTTILLCIVAKRNA